MSLPTAQSMGKTMQPPAPLRKGMSALGRVPKKQTTGSYCDHSGWGSKQGNMIKSWKRRYFVLKGLELIYFAERSPSGKGLDEKGRLKIAAVDFNPNFHNALVVTGTLKNRKMLMQLESNDDCKEWFTKMSAALQDAKAAEVSAARASASGSNQSGRVGGDAAMEGWLYKEGQNFKTWKKRYMTLTGKSLRYHAAKGEPPKDEVRVQSVNINKSRKFALDIYSDNNRILRIAASSFEEIEAWDRALAKAIRRRPCFGGDALSDQPAPFLGMGSLLDVDCDGWLYMPGNLTSALKKRYFTLKRSVLQYADHPGENSKGEGSVIDLKLGSQIQQLEVKLDDGKWICVTADSMDEYKKWLFALCDVLDRVPSSLEQATESAAGHHFSLKTVGTLVMMGQRMNTGAAHTGIRNSDSQNQESIRKTGWLRKEGQRMKSWKRRYFVLDGSTLQYYENVGMKVLKGGGEVERVVPSTKNTNGLDVHFTSGRVLYVAGDSADEIRDWLHTFEGKQPVARGSDLALKRSSTIGSRPSDSTMFSTGNSSSDPFEFARGWLLKQGKNFKTWKQRYFVLHGRSLSYAKGVDETAIGTGIVEHVAFSDSRPFALSVQLSNGRVLTLVASVEDEFMMWCRAFKASFEHTDEDESDDELSDFDHDDQDDDIAILDSQYINTSLLQLPSLGEDDDELDELDDVDALVSDPNAQTEEATTPAEEANARESDADVMPPVRQKELQVNAQFNTDMVICSGWLRKQGGNIKSWKERFFTLYGTLLRYYKTENGPLLGGATIVHVSTVRTRKHCYEITLENGRNLLVLAESETESERWLDAFRRATAAAKEEKAQAAAAAAESAAPVRRGITRATASAHLLDRSASGSLSSSFSSASSDSNEQTEIVYEV